MGSGKGQILGSVLWTDLRDSSGMGRLARRNWLKDKLWGIKRYPRGMLKLDPQAV